jgi:hypothetical protein
MGDGDLSEMFEGLLVDLCHCGIDAFIKVTPPPCFRSANVKPPLQ